MRNNSTFVISKQVGRISNAWKLVKKMFPKATIGRYTRADLWDGWGTMLHHDINYYFEIHYDIA